MTLYCEICGRELGQSEAKRVVVEGSLLIVCQDCFTKLSKKTTVREEQRKPIIHRDKGLVKKTQFSQPRQRSIEEYEVVEDYATRVKTARERIGWSQEVLAQKIGEGVNVVKRIETGKLKPSIELAKKLEKILGVRLLEPVVDEETKTTTRSKRDDYLTIGDLIDVNSDRDRGV